VIRKLLPALATVLLWPTPASAQGPVHQCVDDLGYPYTAGWGNDGPAIDLEADQCVLVGENPGPHTWEIFEGQVAFASEVQAYLDHLYQVELFLRWHSVWRWESTGLIECESNGDWHINTGNGYFGGAQMSMAFWRSYGGLEFAARPDLAEPWQQVVVLDRWRDGGGRFRDAFPGCARELGLR
jgi:hypothetical protein